MYKNSIDTKLKALLHEGYVIEPAKLASYLAKEVDAEVRAVAIPQTREQVPEILALAREHKQALYPISTGKNWGLGAKQPVAGPVILLDLSALRKIIHLNLRYGYAVVEPGVTQGQLAKHLEDIDAPYIINVTGSASETSLLGNCLERGDGYYNLRANDVLGMEVLLGNGQVIKTGFGQVANSRSEYLYPMGLGPDLQGLFFQSNFGVILSIGFRLIPKQEVHSIVVCRLEQEKHLPAFLEAIFRLKRLRIWDTEIHVADAERSKSSALPLLCDYYLQTGLSKKSARKKAEDCFRTEATHSWSALGALSGNKEDVQRSFARIRKLMKPFGKASLLSRSSWKKAKKITELLSSLESMRRKDAMLYTVAPLLGVVEGKPTDAAVKSVHWNIKYPHKHSADLGRTNTEVLFTCPLLPFEGLFLEEMVAQTRSIFKDKGFDCAITLNTFNANSIGAVINIVFDRRDEVQRSKALKALKAVNANFQKQSIPMYRLGVASMGDWIDSESAHWQLIGKLKRLLDPDNVIAPGRYSLLVTDSPTNVDAVAVNDAPGPQSS